MTTLPCDQIIVAPNPINLEQYAVWRNIGSVEPFNFGQLPIEVFNTRQEAMAFALRKADGKSDIRFTHRYVVVGYRDFTYLGMVKTSFERVACDAKYGCGRSAGELFSVYVKDVNAERNQDDRISAWVCHECVESNKNFSWDAK